jgi:hypothetical protein
VLVLAGLALACASGGAAPRPRADCDAVRLPPRHQRLSQVLEELSAARAFRLVNRTREDPYVSHVGGDEMSVMRALSGQANLLVRYKPVEGCPGEWKLDTVWVLPREQAAPKGASAVPDAAAIAKSQADAAAAKQAMDMYMRAHGEAQPTGSAASGPAP